MPIQHPVYSALFIVQVADYNSCSPVVERVMSADVMRSCLVLVEDILEVLPVLLYQVRTVCPVCIHPVAPTS